MSDAMVFAMRYGKRTVAHLSPGKLRLPYCKRGVDMTSNLPGGRRVCKDCMRIVQAANQQNSPLEAPK